MKVTYHDPCYLGRYCRLYDAPREIIQAVPGVELIEMERNRMDAWCCGADVLVAACPVSIENFNKAEESGTLKIQFLDMAELPCKSLA